MSSRDENDATTQLDRLRVRGNFFGLVAAGLLGACSPNGGTVDAEDKAKTESIEIYRNEVQVVAGIEKDARLQGMEKRLAKLERELDTLKANPITVDLDLLTQRVAAVEMGAYQASASTAAPKRNVATESAAAAVQEAMTKKRIKPPPE
jgi:hypothetical protein